MAWKPSIWSLNPTREARRHSQVWESRGSATGSALFFWRTSKDVSDLFLADPDLFRERIQQALESAIPWAAHEARERAARAAECLRGCEKLANEPRILDRLAEDLVRGGLVGELRPAKLVYLAATSRLLERPVSIVVKGPSSAGKSFTVKQALAFLPAGAYHELTAMSEKALVYSDEPLQHRMLLICEATGLESELASYMVRSLLSEGRLRYETVESTSEGLRPRIIEREGPTGLIVTTTAVRLHPENETRLISIPVKDSTEQTRAILDGLADDRPRNVDYKPWHSLQEWIEANPTTVHIPYAHELLRAIPPVAVRLRRDSSALLRLIETHALLHQASRARDPQGRIIATLDDYAIVRELVYDLVAEGIDATVPAVIRETVAAVPAADDQPVTLRQVAETLGIDKSAASRRVKHAIERGYLTNLADGARGKPMRLVQGEPLPADREILPTVNAIADSIAKHRPEAAEQETVDALHTEPQGGVPTSDKPLTVVVADLKDAPACRFGGHHTSVWCNDAGRQICRVCHPPAHKTPRGVWAWP